MCSITEYGTRNPSPPDLTNEEKDIIESDFIGQTIFSKKWVLSTMMKMVDHVKYTKCTKYYDNSKDDDVINEAIQGNNEGHEGEDRSVYDLDGQFEEELCELWDMTMNEDIAVFLCDNDCDEFLLDVTRSTRCLRLQEICLGILGNVVCVATVCTTLSEKDQFRNIILGQLSNSDSPCLVEVTRLLNVVLSKKDAHALWINTIKELSSVDMCILILKNSLNVHLILNVSELLDAIFDLDEELLIDHSNEELFSAIQEAYEQVKKEKQEGISILLHILQLCSTVTEGVRALVSSDTATFLCSFIHDHRNDVVITESRESALASAFSVLDCMLVANPTPIAAMLESDPSIVSHLLDVMHLEVNYQLQQRELEVRTPGADDAPDKHTHAKLNYFEMFLSFLYNLCMQLGSSSDLDQLLSLLKSKEVVLVEILISSIKHGCPDWLPHVRGLLNLNTTHKVFESAKLQCPIVTLFMRDVT